LDGEPVAPDKARSALFGMLFAGDALSADCRDLYISAVSRTLVAAMLSPPATFERYEQVLAEARKAAVRHGRIAPAARLEHDPALREARMRLRQAYTDRLVMLSDILMSNLQLRIRFLDMFARELVAICSQQIMRGWAVLRQRIPRPSVGVLMGKGESSICYPMFRSLLMGAENSAGSSPGIAGEGERLAEALRAWIPPDRFCGAQPGWIDSLQARFFEGHIELPFIEPEGRAEPAARLIEAWISAALSSVVIVPASEIIQESADETHQG
jgi:hypothetical protein